VQVWRANNVHLMFRSQKNKESQLGLGWRHSPLVLGLIRDKGCWLRGQVSLACKSRNPLYKERRCINLIRQELRRKNLPSCLAVGERPAAGSLSPSQP
jgi:hypothetical protein